jgi:hypothetical protein
LPPHCCWASRGRGTVSRLENVIVCIKNSLRNSQFQPVQNKTNPAASYGSGCAVIFCLYILGGSFSLKEDAYPTDH